MELTKVIYKKVLTRPVTYDKNTFYLIKADGDDYVDYVITGDDSVPYDLISTERIESLILPYDDSTPPVNGQVLIFDGTNFVPDDAPETVPQAVLDHITRTDNPHTVLESQIPSGIDYTLLFENALI
jgi:hypothetical protein